MKKKIDFEKFLCSWLHRTQYRHMVVEVNDALREQGQEYSEGKIIQVSDEQRPHSSLDRTLMGSKLSTLHETLKDHNKDYISNLWHDASDGQPEVGRLHLNMSGRSGGISIRIRDEQHVLATENRWVYIEDILPDGCDKEQVLRLTKMFMGWEQRK